MGIFHDGVSKGSVCAMVRHRLSSVSFLVKGIRKGPEGFVRVAWVTQHRAGRELRPVGGA